MNCDYKVWDIIEQRLIKVYFQGILSHHKEFPKSLEVFVKGVNPVDGSEIHPNDLFICAADQGYLYELNKRMVQVSIESFRRIYTLEQDILLYINIHESLVKKGGITIDWLAQMALNNGIPTEVIALDITDYSDLSVEVVKEFIRSSRQAGFYISIDDIGKNYFNLDRILVYNPDIIKINRQYLERLPLDSYRELLVKQISYLAHEMGIVVVVTGIETEAMLNDAYLSGVQYFQGYFLKKPVVVEDDELEEALNLSALQDRFKTTEAHTNVEENRAMMNKVVLVLNHIGELSVRLTEHKPNDAFERLFYRYPFIHNAWVVNMEGVQVTEGKVNKKGFRKRNAGIFKIYGKGHDYSKDEFYRIITSGALNMWITKPYISLLNNQVCVATSSFITSLEGNQYILCLEIDYKLFQKMNKSELLHENSVILS